MTDIVCYQLIRVAGLFTFWAIDFNIKHINQKILLEIRTLSAIAHNPYPLSYGGGQESEIINCEL